MTETTLTAPPYVGVGLYTIPEAAHIIGVKTPKLRRWIGEYQRTATDGIRKLGKPVIARHFTDGERLLTFLELVELLFVKLFRAEGVPMTVIRKASDEAARLFGTRYPFAVKRFDTDGRRIFATLQDHTDDQRAVLELGKGQLVFESVVRPFFRKLEYRDGGEALRYWPLDRNGRIVLDPERSFGKPIDAETGVPTKALYDAVTAGGGQSPESVAEWFGVPREAVQAAVTYESALLVKDGVLATGGLARDTVACHQTVRPAGASGYMWQDPATRANPPPIDVSVLVHGSRPPNVRPKCSSHSSR
jgi:uncharacterized protein (DUF433 family)